MSTLGFFLWLKPANTNNVKEGNQKCEQTSNLNVKSLIYMPKNLESVVDNFD